MLGKPISMRFRQSLQIDFEDTWVPSGRVAGKALLPRRLTLRAATPVAVELQSVAAFIPSEVSQSSAREEIRTVGVPGTVEPGSSHVFAMMLPESHLEGGILEIRCVRKSASSCFLPWQGCHVHPCVGQPPHIHLSQPIPAKGPASVPAPLPSADGVLDVGLKYDSTATAGTPLLVRVHLKGK